MNTLSKEMSFFIYLLDHYAAYKNTTAPCMLKKWNALKLRNLIYNLYPIYHVERLENAFDDIDLLVAEKEAELQSGAAAQ